jgi:drug/metabolite transporter (DMT)-like permease
VLGERPTVQGVAALALGVAGVAVLLGAPQGGEVAVGSEKLPACCSRSARRSCSPSGL